MKIRSRLQQEFRRCGWLVAAAALTVAGAVPRGAHAAGTGATIIEQGALPTPTATVPKPSATPGTPLPAGAERVARITTRLLSGSAVQRGDRFTIRVAVESNDTDITPTIAALNVVYPSSQVALQRASALELGPPRMATKDLGTREVTTRFVSTLGVQRVPTLTPGIYDLHFTVVGLEPRVFSICLQDPAVVTGGGVSLHGPGMKSRVPVKYDCSATEKLGKPTPAKREDPLLFE